MIAHLSQSGYPVTRSITIEIPPGELVDRVTILEIKSERLSDPHKRAVVTKSLSALTAVYEAVTHSSDELCSFRAALRNVNETLWDAENAIRTFEERKDFGSQFVATARSIYQLNDQRARLKHAIDSALCASTTEVKEYQD